MSIIPRLVICLSIAASGCSSLPSDLAEPEEAGQHLNACAAPSWFGKRDSQPPLWRAYGQGHTETQAVDQAHASVARQISTRVTTRCTDFEQSQQDGSGKANWTAEQSCRLTSQAHRKLELARVTQRHQCDQQFFVEVVWDQRPLYQRLSHLVHQQPVSRVPGPLIKAFERAGAQIARKGLPVGLTWHDGLWGLEVNGEKLTLTENLVWQALDWNGGVGELENSARLEFLQGGQPVTRVIAGEELDMRLQALASKGYVTLINVHDQGQVRVLLANAPLARQKQWRLKSHLQPGQTRSIEGYVALISPERLDLTAFDGNNVVEHAQDHERLAALLALMSNHRPTNLARAQLLITRAQ